MTGFKHEPSERATFSYILDHGGTVCMLEETHFDGIQTWHDIRKLSLA